MDIRKELIKAVELGYPLAAIAKHIGKDPSTLHKWYKGTRNVSPEVERLVEKELLRLKGLWNEILKEEE